MVRDERWKCVEYLGDNIGQLFDLENDPDELTNLWDDPAQATRKADFARQLLDTLIALSPRAHVPWNKGAPKL
ncbi:MAG: DUF4976 domain-containing protein, partial [Victivallales bacterium]|nr:DUF4976 domain-containing protein [Victivallales bacterium]